MARVSFGAARCRAPHAFHNPRKADCETSFEEICLGRIVRCSASKNCPATGVTYDSDTVHSLLARVAFTTFHYRFQIAFGMRFSQQSKLFAPG